MKSIKWLATSRILLIVIAIVDPIAPKAAIMEERLSSEQKAHDRQLSPAVVGFGNAFVPGLGATLRGMPVRGLAEAGVELGTFYGGTFGVREGAYHIDGSVNYPTQGSIYRATSGQILQQVGLKLHMFDTFYHYQHAAYARRDLESEQSIGQPLYLGDWKDVLSSPFRWKNLSSTWTWPVLTAVTAYLVYDFSSSTVAHVNLRTGTWGNAYYAFNDLVSVPFGSSFGEDVFFRGFLQREALHLTGSLPLAIAFQSSMFSLAHADHVTSFLVGAYFGLMANQLHGDLEPAMCSHFWINVVLGVLDYWSFQRAQYKPVPFNPPISMKFSIPF